MELLDILNFAVQTGASDVFIIAGMSVAYRRSGEVIRSEGERLLPPQTNAIVKQIYELSGRDMTRLQETGDDDFSLSVKDLSRFRVNTFRQRGAFSAVIRVVSFELPNPVECHIPDAVLQLGEARKGMVLITGPAGSGKSTTLACIIDRINHTRSGHIITLEDPIEHLHRHDKSIVTQREISLDTESYVSSIRAALRQSPDVILLGEMRDYETIAAAMTAAETGHLLFSTLHTTGAANTIDRIIDVFPANQQRQIAVQLSMVLNAVVSQQLVPAIGGGVVPAFEIMTVTPAIRNLIRENKVHQIDGVILSSAREGMVSMDASLQSLFREGAITRDTALAFASNPEMLEKKL